MLEMKPLFSKENLKVLLEEIKKLKKYSYVFQRKKYY